MPTASPESIKRRAPSHDSFLYSWAVHLRCTGALSKLMTPIFRDIHERQAKALLSSFSLSRCCYSLLLRFPTFDNALFRTTHYVVCVLPLRFRALSATLSTTKRNIAYPLALTSPCLLLFARNSFVVPSTTGELFPCTPYSRG